MARHKKKKLWWVGFNLNGGPRSHDFYEARVPGRVFNNKGRINFNAFVEGNEAKKLSWGGDIFTGTGGVFHRKSLGVGLKGKVRFSSKFSVDLSVGTEQHTNSAGWAATLAAGALPDTVIFSRRNLYTVENILNLKYNFNNRMGLSIRGRHYWSKVAPQQFYQLDIYGDLQTPTNPFTQNVKQNYNFLSVDMVYTWQFAQGSFVNIVWKDIAENFSRQFEKDYTKNLNNSIEGPQFNSLSLRVIYFLDYLSVKNKVRKTNP